MFFQFVFNSVRIANSFSLWVTLSLFFGRLGMNLKNIRWYRPKPSMSVSYTVTRSCQYFNGLLILTTRSKTKKEIRYPTSFVTGIFNGIVQVRRFQSLSQISYSSHPTVLGDHVFELGH